LALKEEEDVSPFVVVADIRELQLFATTTCTTTTEETDFTTTTTKAKLMRTTTTEMMSSKNHHHRKSKKRLDSAGRTSFCDHLGLAEQIHRKSLDVKEMHQLLVERLKGMNHHHHHHPREEKEEEEMGGEEMEGDDRLFSGAASWPENGRKEQNAEEEENFPASIRSSSCTRR
jgi:hypothetical protein